MPTFVTSEDQPGEDGTTEGAHAGVVETPCIVQGHRGTRASADEGNEQGGKKIKKYLHS